MMPSLKTGASALGVAALAALAFWGYRGLGSIWILSSLSLCA